VGIAVEERGSRCQRGRDKAASYVSHSFPLTKLSSLKYIHRDVPNIITVLVLETFALFAVLIGFNLSHRRSDLSFAS